MNLTEAIKAVLRALASMEDGALYDDLAGVLGYLMKRKANLEKARRIGEAYSHGVAPELRLR